MENILETKIKEVGRITTYTTIKGKTKEELFDNIYQYFKSNQYCWQVDRTFEDKTLEKEYRDWSSKNSKKLWWKHATGRDFD
jgi:hypothetical protein